MEQKDVDVKTRILLAAKKLFANQGFDGTSVRQICEEAGANVALVSYHFGGKDNVFFALFDTYFPSRKLGELAPLFRDPVEGVKVLVREVISFRMAEPELARILHQEIVMRSHRTEGLRKYIFPVWKQLRELLESGRQAGVFRFLSLDNAMFFVMGAVIFPRSVDFLEPLLTDGTQTADELIEETCRFVLGGLGHHT